MSTTNRSASGGPAVVPILAEGESPRRGLGPGLAGLHLTPEEFDAIDYEDCERGYRYELIQGVVAVNPAPGLSHNSPNEYLGYLLLTYKENHPQGNVLDDTGMEVYVRVPNGRRLADRVLWIGLGRQVRPKRDIPTIIVEFVSESRRDWLRDYVEKRDEYLTLGVKEYWVIDRFRRMMTVFRPAESGEAETMVPEAGTYTTPLLPGFALPIARLIEKADRWTSTESE
jgi:Uma2 family endonuclease